MAGDAALSYGGMRMPFLDLLFYVGVTVQAEFRLRAVQDALIRRTVRIVTFSALSAGKWRMKNGIFLMGQIMTLTA